VIMYFVGWRYCTGTHRYQIRSDAMRSDQIRSDPVSSVAVSGWQGRVLCLLSTLLHLTWASNDVHACSIYLLQGIRMSLQSTRSRFDYERMGLQCTYWTVLYCTAACSIGDLALSPVLCVHWCICAHPPTPRHDAI
jgi:hypothetical protein